MKGSSEKLIIRKEQMRAFSNYMKNSFEDRMVVHLRGKFPKETEKLPEQELRQTIKKGTESAAKYEIVRECDVAKYIELMFCLAPDFDVSQDTPWAGSILTDSGLNGEAKITKLLMYADSLQETND